MPGIDELAAQNLQQNHQGPLQVAAPAAGNGYQAGDSFSSTGPRGTGDYGPSAGGGSITNVTADQAIGSQMGSISNGQLAGLYQDPNAERNNALIAGMQGQMLQGYGPGGSSLAGLTQLGAVQNAQTANIDTGQSNNLMGGQIQNINALNAQAQGQGPSVAEQQAKQQAQANISAQMAMAGSQRGSANSALGLRAAQDQGAQANQQAVQAGALGRSQEAMQARSQLGQALGGATGQAQQGAQAQAQLAQGASLQNASQANQAILQQGQMDQSTQIANLQAQLQAGQINMGQYNAMVQAALQQSNNQFSANQNYGGLLVGENTQLQGIMHNQAISNSANSLGITSGVVGGAAGAVAGGLSAMAPKPSDARLKTSIKSGARSIKDFLSQLGPSKSAFALMESV